MTSVTTRTAFLAFLALLMATPCATAQDADDAEKPKVYQVELLLFRHADQSRTTSEIPRMPEQEIADILEQDLPRIDATDQQSTSYEAAAAQSPYWRVLATDQLLLNNVSNRLNSLGAYELVSHVGWLQTAPDVADAADLSLIDLGIYQDQAIGSIKLFKRRYLHLAVDVALPGNSRDAFNVFTAAEAAPAINESRRMRLENLVYFDQPQFGIIAMVARSEVDLELEP